MNRIFIKPKGEIETMISGRSITDCWLNLCDQIYTHGYEAVTPKDEGIGKELQHVLVKVPIKDPRTHKLYGGFAKREGEALNQYIEQIVGETSHETDFKYTYHQRLRHYGTNSPQEQGGYDQIKTLVNLIMPFKRSYQAITWYVPEDNEADITGGDQPCLLVLWCWLGWNTALNINKEMAVLTRFYKDHDRTKVLYHKMIDELDALLRSINLSLELDMFCMWRNRDAGSAWLDNVCGMVDLQIQIAHMIQERIGVPVRWRYYYDSNIAIQLYPRDFENIRLALKERSK